MTEQKRLTVNNSKERVPVQFGRNSPMRDLPDHPAMTYLSAEKSISRLSMKSMKGMPFRTNERANKRSKNGSKLKGSHRNNSHHKPLIDTETIHYNPTGPGDYTLPSTFGNLPKPTKKNKRNQRATMQSL